MLFIFDGIIPNDDSALASLVIFVMFDATVLNDVQTMHKQCLDSEDTYLRSPKMLLFAHKVLGVCNIMFQKY